jgi:hypothetical protein
VQSYGMIYQLLCFCNFLQVLLLRPVLHASSRQFGMHCEPQSPVGQTKGAARLSLSAHAHKVWTTYTTHVAQGCQVCQMQFWVGQMVNPPGFLQET